MKWYALRLKNKTYSGIDFFPVFYWWKVHSTQDFSWILKRAWKTNRFENKILSDKWEEIYSEYIDRFGFGETFESIIEKRREIASLKFLKVETGDMSFSARIKVAEYELTQLTDSESGKNDFMESKILIEKYAGFRIDPYTVSVSEYFSIIKQMKKTPERASA